MRETKLKEQFIAVAERLRHAQLTAEQLAALHSVQYYAHSGKQRVYAKRRTFLIGAVIFLVISISLTLTPLSQLAAVLFEVFGVQVMYFVALLQFVYSQIS